MRILQLLVIGAFLSVFGHAQTLAGASRTHLSTLNNKNSLPAAGLIEAWDFSDPVNQPTATGMVRGDVLRWVNQGSQYRLWTGTGVRLSPTNLMSALISTTFPPIATSFTAMFTFRDNSATPSVDFAEVAGAQDPNNVNNGWSIRTVGNKFVYEAQFVGAWGNASFTSINDDKWHTMAITISGTNLTYYLDGVADGGYSNSATPVSWNGPFGVGSVCGSLTDAACGGSFSGNLDMAGFALWSRALSAAEVKSAAPYMLSLVNKWNATPYTSLTYPLVNVPMNGLALTPPMGFSTYYAYNLTPTAQNVKDASDYFKTSGLLAAGYNYINLDDAGTKRLPTGVLTLNPTLFPLGAVDLVSYIKANGEKAGMYSSPAANTCGGAAGSYLNEALDANTFDTWGFEFLKYDFCASPVTYGFGTPNADSMARYEYQIMGQALQEIHARNGHNIVFSLSTNNSYSWMNVAGVNMARYSPDVESWTFVQYIFDHPPVAALSQPGVWNDSDELQVGNTSTLVNPTPFTDDQGKQQMSLWSLLTSPLIESAPVSATAPLSANSLATLLNPAIISIDQDPAGIGGIRISQAFCSGSSGPTCEVWGKQLTGTNTCAIGFFNRDGSNAHTFSITWAAVAAVIPACGSGPYTTTSNIWATWPTCAGGAGHDCSATAGVLASGYTAAAVPADGVTILKVAP